MATSDNYDLPDDAVPVFIINGFLEAGKTDFIKFTMDQEYFQTEGTTVLLLCEEGESEYDEKLLKKNHTVVVPVEKETDFNKEYLTSLEEKYHPERFIIEWNGMWNQDDLYDGPMSKRCCRRHRIARQIMRFPFLMTGSSIRLSPSWTAPHWTFISTT